MSGAQRTSRRSWLEAGAVWTLIAAVVAVNAYRAATQSMTHDEATGYLLYIRGAWHQMFEHVVNRRNHVLFSILSKFVVDTFGATELTIRLPTVAGGAVYCAAVAAICARLFDRFALRLSAIAVLILNPYVMDFLSAARGYGLQLAMLFVAVYLLLPSDQPVRRDWKAAAAAGAALGLSIAAVMTAAFPALGVVAACVVCAWLDGRLKSGVTNGAVMLATAAAVSLSFLIAPLWGAPMSENYYGAGNVIGSAASIVRGGWRHMGPDLVAGSLALLTPVEVVITGAVAVLLIGMFIAAAAQFLRWSSLSQVERAFVWMMCVLTATAGASIAAHYVVAVKYPFGRTGLYWIPLVTLTTLIGLELTPARSVWRVVGWAAIAVVLANDVRRFQTYAYADWPFDAANRTIVSRIAEDHAGKSTRATVGGSWFLEPGVNFYRTVRQLDWMAPMEWRQFPVAGDDYYVFRAEDVGFEDVFGLRRIFTDDRVGAWLAVPIR